MTRHFTPEEFIDAIEQPLSLEREAHLADCPPCAAELAGMRTLTADLSIAGTVPEPSPLFWDHLSAHVRDAVGAVPMPAPWWHTAWKPAVAFAGMLGALALVVLLRPAPAPVAVTATVDAPEPVAATVAMGDDAEAVWDMINTLAPAIPVKDAVDAGLEPSRGVTEDAIASLTSDERKELVKLLRAEMGSSE
jgi:hypothetical protein